LFAGRSNRIGFSAECINYCGRDRLLPQIQEINIHSGLKNAEVLPCMPDTFEPDYEHVEIFIVYTFAIKMKSMKEILLVIVNLAIPWFLVAQATFQNTLADQLGGIKQEDNAYYILGNYSIFREDTHKEFTEKNVRKLKNKYAESGAETYSSPTLKEENLVIRRKESDKSNTPVYRSYYLINHHDATTVIGFYSTDYQDTLREYEFIRISLANQIPASVYISDPVKKLEFAGRTQDIGGACQLMNVNDIQCPHSGELNWALHENLPAAQKALDNQYRIVKNRNMSTILSEDMVDVVFEGKATQAKKIVLKVSVPKIVTGGSNELVVYFVAEEIRGRFVSCVLSHYTDERLTADGVPVFLGMVMKVK